MTDPLEPLEETQHVIGIQRLQGAYADAINRRAWDELDALFLPDCLVEIDARRGDPIHAVGGAGVGGFVGPAVERFDFFEFVILSTHVVVESAADAWARLYMCEVRHDPTAGGRSDAFGVYHDRYRRVDDRWRFAHRRYHSLARSSSPGGTDRTMDVFPFPHTATDAL